MALFFFLAAGGVALTLAGVLLSWRGHASDVYVRSSRGSAYSRRLRGTFRVIKLYEVRAPGLERTALWTASILCAVVCLVLFSYILRGAFVPDPTIVTFKYPDIAASAPVPTTGTPVAKDVQKLAKASSAQRMTATSTIVRLAQLDASLYDNQNQASAYMYSACSTASMTEVINAWQKVLHTGKTYTIGQVLDTEIAVGAITSDLGLTDDHGIDRTLAKYNLAVTWLQTPSVDDLIGVSSKTPVIIDFPPGNWSGGHLLVARGGDANYVYLVDSSNLNMHAMARGTAYGQFSYYWNGFAAVASPM